MAFRAGMKGSMEPQGGFGLDRLRLLVVFGCVFVLVVSLYSVVLGCFH